MNFNTKYGLNNIKNLPYKKENFEKTVDDLIDIPFSTNFSAAKDKALADRKNIKNPDIRKNAVANSFEAAAQKCILKLDAEADKRIEKDFTGYFSKTDDKQGKQEKKKKSF
jgi:hypothetical protein